MSGKVYMVDLTEERQYLLDFIKSGTKSARKLNRARILLLADEGKTDPEIVDALHTGIATVQRTRKRFVQATWNVRSMKTPDQVGNGSWTRKGNLFWNS